MGRAQHSADDFETRGPTGRQHIPLTVWTIRAQSTSPCSEPELARQCAIDTEAEYTSPSASFKMPVYSYHLCPSRRGPCVTQILSSSGGNEGSIFAASRFIIFIIEPSATPCIWFCRPAARATIDTIAMFPGAIESRARYRQRGHRREKRSGPPVRHGPSPLRTFSNPFGRIRSQ